MTGGVCLPSECCGNCGRGHEYVLIEIPAIRIACYDVLGEGQVVRGMHIPGAGDTLTVEVGPSMVIWKDDRGIGPYEDFSDAADALVFPGQQRVERRRTKTLTFRKDEPVKVLKGWPGYPLTRWRPF